MHASTVGEFFSYPNIFILFLTILACIANVFIGVSILPKDKRKKGYLAHKVGFWVVLALYSVFLFYNHRLLENNYFDWFVFFYFAVVVQWSRKINVTLHAVIASIGLVMLMVVICFSVF
jgi:hypothetical protein